MATITGLWRFNEIISTPTWTDQTVRSIKIYLSNNRLQHMLHSGYRYTDGQLIGLVSGSGKVLVYDYTTESWGGPHPMRIIKFDSDTIVSDDFFSWVQANAVQIEAIPTTVLRDDTVLAEIEQGQVLTLNCMGKKSTSAVYIIFDSSSKGSITYDGVTNEIEMGIYLGTTANLLCAGKKFATDVVVAVGGQSAAP